jgi:hypothetical protein
MIDRYAGVNTMEDDWMGKINKRDGGNPKPMRGVTKKEAARILKANAAGKKVEPTKLTQAKKAARDHYAGEADQADRERG